MERTVNFDFDEISDKLLGKRLAKQQNHMYTPDEIYQVVYLRFGSLTNFKKSIRNCS